MDWDVAHAFLAKSMRDVPDDIPNLRESIVHHCWSSLPAKAQSEHFARYCIEKSGAGAFGWLPASLRTDGVRQFTVLAYPECIDSLSPVFSNTGDRDGFLEGTWPGILRDMNLLLAVAARETFAAAFVMAMRNRTLGSIVPETLPVFD